MSAFFLSLVMQHLSNASLGIVKVQLEMRIPQLDAALSTQY